MGPQRVKHDLVTKQQQVEKCAPCNITKAPMLEEQHSVHFAEEETKLLKGRCLRGPQLVKW